MSSSPSAVLKRFRIAENVYLLGTFETGLTINNQQVRALNLVWSMVEAASAKNLRRIAVVGGGFAGLTAAAGLLHKGAEHVSLFEKRTSLCPLQQGSDARWVHPRIYDWPGYDSNLPTAALPLLNWHAGRASDVVVEVLRDWEYLARKAERQIAVYLNVKHLRLDQHLDVEWVGEKSDVGSRATPSGSKERFDSIILAVGFGHELDTPFPYWRNETLGQPELDLGKRTYLDSGHGDGALVDLFRIRISRFRQDRILVDLFGNKAELLQVLRKIKREHDAHPIQSEKLYQSFERLAADPGSGFDQIVDSLRGRLRADTAAILQMSPSVNSFKSVFSSRASFQNRFLLFALYRAGGLIPTSQQNCDKICNEYGIKKRDIIRRHGTDRTEAVEDVMDRALLRSCKKRISYLRNNSSQPSSVCWSGGYWHQHSIRLKGQPLADDASKARWRLEHLPPATEVLATGFVTAIAGYLDALGSAEPDFRVTLHRTLYVGSEVTLQQAAQYTGPTKRLGAAGRTFGFNHATMGYAAVKRKIVRTRPRTVKDTQAAYANSLQNDMRELNLTSHSQNMAPSVRSILAIPILTPDKKRTIAVLYCDSTEFNAFNDTCVAAIRQMCQWFASKIEEVYSDRVRNFQIQAPTVAPQVSPLLPAKLKIVQAINSPSAPSAKTATYLNLEFTDFVVAGGV